MTKIRNNRKAFTLGELLIAGMIFAIISLIAVSIFINVSKYNRRINLENHIYSEAYILMEKLAREVKKGTIDYEEYHSRLVISDDVFGANYGEYAKKFYHPGYCTNNTSAECTVTGIDKGFGLLCNDQTRRYPGVTTDPDYPCTPYQPSQDIRGGMNPYLGYHTDTAGTNIDSTEADQATAFCDSLHNQALDTAAVNKNCDNDGTSGLSAADFQRLHTQEELYLINGSGDQKTMIARERINDGPNGTPKDTDDEYAVSFIRLSGEDINQDDIRETWTCTQDFVCTADTKTKPDPEDLDCLNFLYDYTNGAPWNCASSSTPELLSSENFIPLTPSDINVVSLKFLVSPLEDPFKAYEESSAQYDYILMQPYVTMVLTVKPAYEKAKNVYPDPANLPEITLQTTVSARAYNEITSY